MKKIALFVSVLLLSAALFAEAPTFEAKPGISGSATMTFGIDLDASASGISNANAANLTLALIPVGTTEKGGKDGEQVYGWIKLANLEMKVDNGDQASDAEKKNVNLIIETPEISARLYLGPVYIDILGVDNKMTKAGTIKKAIIVNQTTDVSNELAGEYKGFAIGLKDTSVVDVVIGVNSLYDWASGSTAATYKLDTATGAIVVDAAASTNKANVDNIYQFYVGAALKAVPNLTAEVSANFGMDTDVAGVSVYQLGAGAKAAYKVAIAEGISVEPYVGFDMQNIGNSGTTLGTAWTLNVINWQLDTGLNLVLPGKVKNIEFGKKTWDGGKDNGIDYTPGLSATLTMSGSSATATFGGSSATASANGATDLGLYFYDGDIIPVFNLLAAAEMTDLSKVGTAGATALGLWANVDLGQVAPYAEVWYQQPNAANSNSNLKLEIGVPVTVVTNTTFTLKYYNDGIGTDTNPAKKGVITFETKIAY